MTKPEIKFYCSRWGHETMPWKDFVAKVQKHAFDGVEIIALRYPEQHNDMMAELERSGMEYALIHTEKKEGSDFQKYLSKLESNLYDITTNYCTSNIAPQFIISQTGREYYTKDQVAECFVICDRVSRETGIPIIQETHRHRWSFAAHVVKEYLQAFPDIRLALDLSHWFCVSESYLEDQEEALLLALDRSVHLHARVGYTQGPQVTDPRSPENHEALSHHLKWWDRWIETLVAKGVKQCTITPEFGPYPYMPHLPYTNMPVSDLWDINCWMKDLLASRFGR